MKYIALLPVLLVAGCDSPSLQGIFQQPEMPDITPATGEPAAPVETLDPTPPPPPPPQARTVEQFDTTSEEDRAEALAVEPAPAAGPLGTTVASLGSPADPGIWMETPLVSRLTPGRAEYQGNTINVELRPSGGAAGSGSEISLAAMRLLNAPLTGLPIITVYERQVPGR